MVLPGLKPVTTEIKGRVSNRCTNQTPNTFEIVHQTLNSIDRFSISCCPSTNETCQSAINLCLQNGTAKCGQKKIDSRWEEKMHPKKSGDCTSMPSSHVIRWHISNFGVNSSFNTDIDCCPNKFFRIRNTRPTDIIGCLLHSVYIWWRFSKIDKFEAIKRINLRLRS